MSITKIVVMVVTIAVFAIALGFGKIGGRSLADIWFPNDGPEGLVKAASDELNRTLPRMLNASTRIDSTVAISGKLLRYNYTLTGALAAEISASQVNALEDSVVQVTCDQQDRNLLAKGVALSFRYKDINGDLVREFEIKPRTCFFDPFRKKWSLMSTPIEVAPEI